MDIDQEQKEQALQKAKELMAAGEKQRAHLRLSRQLEEFELGNIKVLLHDEFVGNISQRIIVASHDGPPGRAESLVEKLGKHACDEDGAIRERAVMALSFLFWSFVRRGTRRVAGQSDIYAGALVKGGNNILSGL